MNYMYFMTLLWFKNVCNSVKQHYEVIWFLIGSMFAVQFFTVK